jgi:hypothetical protein
LNDVSALLSWTTTVERVAASAGATRPERLSAPVAAIASARTIRDAFMYFSLLEMTEQSFLGTYKNDHAVMGISTLWLFVCTLLSNLSFFAICDIPVTFMHLILLIHERTLCHRLCGWFSARHSSGSDRNHDGERGR